MKEKDSIFQFKKFSVSHGRSALKVGVDGVLIGLWCNFNQKSEYSKILDVGCGCGVISLICAQRFPMAQVMGIDLHLPSVNETFLNFRNSPWQDRLKVEFGDYSEFIATKFHQIKSSVRLSSDRDECNIPDEGHADNSEGELFDLIVSNPPFFEDGVEPKTSREIARHAATLSPQSLIIKSKDILKPGGSLCMIIPLFYEIRILKLAVEIGYEIKRICRVSGRIDSKPKRVMIELTNLSTSMNILNLSAGTKISEEIKQKYDECGVRDNGYDPNPDGGYIIEQLVLEESRGLPTSEYQQLGKDFYLKF